MFGTDQNPSMLTVYIVSAVVAGVLVLLSLLGIGHEVGHDLNFEVAHEVDHDADHGDGAGLWMPFFSMRFYTYFFAAFGTTGLLLHFLTTTPSMIALWISVGVGLFSGLSVSLLM